jgi:5-formyltetrahydrofolate cyclo-ligase
VWKKLEEVNIALFPNYGKIPNFKGAEESAKLLATCKTWQKAKIIFCSPDAAQRYVRYLAIKEGKTVIMATPRLRKSFILLEPSSVTPEDASILRGALSKGKNVGWRTPKPDLIVIGSVAVDLKGNRIGKGGGFGDREIKFFKEKFGNIPVATNVHELQLFDDLSYLMQEHDEKVDIIATNERVVRVH